MSNLIIKRSGRRVRRGTSVILATLALALVAVAASFSVPQWLRAREQQTACEAVDYLTNVYNAQQSYHRQHGHYADDIAQLDLLFVPPTHFEVGRLLVSNAGGTDTWSITLTRYSVPSISPPYSITCTQDGSLRVDGRPSSLLAGVQPRLVR
jgi:type II secretory pathway pseudopilin PulG